MLPYLIAGVIGYGISKLFEDNKAPKYVDGGYIDYSNFRTSVIGLVNDNKVLILQRGSTANWMPNKWSIVGGVIEEGEVPIEAMIRECEEEIGLEPSNVSYDHKIMTTDSGEIYYFVGTLESRNVKLDYENSAYKFISKDEINNYDFVPYVKEFILEIFSRNEKKSKFKRGGDVLLAPNGKPSNLTPEQYKLVRSESFKAWFGDWEKKPANASKVVDSNGEPLVVYHGTSSDFNIFKIGRTGGIFFTNNKNSAERFSIGDLKRLGENPKVIQCFLNIRKYYEKNTNDEILINEYFNDYFQDRPFISKLSQKNILKNKYNRYFMDLVSFGIVNEEPKQKLISYNYDGVIIDADNYSKSYIVFEPEQIKLADGSNTTFDGKNPDIRFERGGKPFDYPRSKVSRSKLFIPNVRGGWTKDKIIKYLKQRYSDTISTFRLVKYISEFENWEELKDHIYYHGTSNYVDKGLKPSITMSEREAERSGGGGYGDRYFGISLTSSKRVAERFSGMYDSVSIYPVILKRDAKVIERTDLKDASEIEDIIVELYEQGVDAVWIGGGEQELVVVNPFSVLIYNKGRETHRVFGGFKSIPLTDEKIKEIYDNSLILAEKYSEEESKIENKEERKDYFRNLPTIQFMAGGELTNKDVLKKFVNQVEAYQSNHYGTFNRDNLVESYHKLPDSIKEKIKPISTKNLFRGADGTSYKSAISFTKNQDYAKMFGTYAFPFKVVKENKGLIDTKRLSALLSKMRIANEIGDDEGEVIVIEPIFSKDIIENIEKFRFDNGGLIAPNGKPSNLTPEQYKLVRTPAFKQWFGDWENYPETASKVVDSNGEPLICYHGQPKFYYAYDENNKWKQYENEKINVFDKSLRKRFTHAEIGFYFSDKETAKEYAEKNGYVYEVFLKIMNPLINKDGVDFNINNKILVSNKLDKNDYNLLLVNNIDGLISFLNYGNYTRLNEIVAFNSNQIKLADGSNDTFDGNNPDIRFDGGGAINKSNDFIGTWEELKKYNPNLWETGILRRSQNPQGATDIIPKDVFIRQFQWQNYGQYDEIEAETIYGEPDNYGYYNDKDGNPITDERTGNYITDELDYENNAERIKATISNKQLKNNLIDSFQTQEGKEYLKKVIATLPKNEDGTITAYRIGTIGEDLQSYTLSEGMAKTFSNQGTDIMPSGLPSIPNEGYKDYGVLPVNKVKINPKGIVAWSPYDSEILVELKYIKTDNSKNSYSDGGSVLLAPNGKPSNLTPEQYKLVRTPEFKAWFGFWDLYAYGKAKNYYEPSVKKIAKELKEEKLSAINEAVNFLSKQVTENDVLIPMPSRYGIATDTRKLAQKISEKTGAKIFDCLVGKKRKSVYEMKKNNQDLSNFDFKFQINCEIPKAKNYFIVDNVIGTGVTMKNALQNVIKNVGTNVSPLVFAIDLNNISKVVDENGEPLVVYKGTSNDYTFNNQEQAYYFTNKIEVAKTYGKVIKPYFLDIKNPLYYDANSNHFYDISDLVGDFEVSLWLAVHRNKSNVIYRFGHPIYVLSNCNGIWIKNIIDVDFETEEKYKWLADTIMVSSSNQIKLADGTNTTFDSNNPDIRYTGGGNLK